MLIILSHNTATLQFLGNLGPFRTFKTAGVNTHQNRKVARMQLGIFIGGV
jgi:hypothetical protein